MVESNRKSSNSNRAARKGRIFFVLPAPSTVEGSFRAERNGACPRIAFIGGPGILGEGVVPVASLKSNFRQDLQNKGKPSG